MKLNRIKYYLFAVLLAFSVSCGELSVENLNNPETERALASSEDLRSLANGLFRSWYVSIHAYNGAQMGLAVGADAATASWGNQAMQLFGTEPRPAWDNAPNFPYAVVTRATFNNMYSINSSATDVLNALQDGMEFGDGGSDNAMIEALAKFNQALSIGYIGLMFDQGYIADENSTDEELTNPELMPYTDLITHAVSKLNEVISISDNNTFTLDEGVIQTNTSVDNVLLGQLAHSFAARFLAYSPRNLSQTNAVNWTTVATHAQNAVQSDFVIEVDQWASGFWYNEGLAYLVFPGWARVDHYVINMMDPTYPAHNPDGDDYPAPDPNNVIDERLLTDYQHLSSNGFNPDRGLYFFSSFRHSRNDNWLGSYSGLLREISKSEIDMLLAEAYYHDGNYIDAATLINNSERSTRGNMPDVAPTAEEVWQGIHHERLVEQFLTGTGNEFFQMRKYDLLQTGTPLHFPIPAATLEVLGEQKPFYTFGGVENADGENTSNGGWR
jgi:starch-binding outer membrane protein, SusD/RagB family